MDEPVCVIAPVRPPRPGILRLARVLHKYLDEVAGHRLLSCVIVGSFTIALRLMLAPLWGLPHPAVEDEFSYLLQAQTFAIGRMANPTHPLWPFFETVHVNMLPTYAGKYPPGQAAFLALGIRLFGHAWYGVLISVGLMCACICWMVQGWLAPRYALLAGIVAGLQFGGNNYWMNSYWGGAVAAAGGALVLGALPRVLRQVRGRTMTVAAVGVLLLLNTRPYEGSVLIGACLIVIAFRCRSRVRDFFQLSRLFGALCVLSIGTGAMAFYNWRVTGDPLELPYMIHQHRYALAPALWVQPLRRTEAPRYRDSAMRDVWEWDLRLYERARENPLNVVYALCAAADGAFLEGPMQIVIGFAAVGFLLALRRKSLRGAAAVGALFLFGVLLEKFILPHYLAPATALVFMFTAVGLRGLWLSEFRSLRVGPVAAVLVISLTALVFVGENAHRIDPLASYPLRPRIAAINQLSRLPGRHVVFVRYSPTHNYHVEYVYNGPDIDSQKIVWAIDRGATMNAQLQHYYRNRTFWLLMPDEARPVLRPYATN